MFLKNVKTSSPADCVGLCCPPISLQVSEHTHVGYLSTQLKVKGGLTRVNGVLRTVMKISATARFIMNKLVADWVRLFFITTWHTRLFPNREITMIRE